MNKETKSELSSSGISFVGLLTVTFIILKLTHIINWSWWWVLAPLWISFGLGIIGIMIVLTVAAIVYKD